MTLYTLGDLKPILRDPERCFVAPGAQVIGQVILEPNSSIWFNAVLRADNEPIRIGEGSNVQDGVVCHVDPGFPLHVGANVTVGHMALLHGCTVGDGTLIGMGAVVLNGAKIGKNCLIGANALITEGKEIPDCSLVMGQPGKVIRTLTDEDIVGLQQAAARYRARSKEYSTDLRAL
ncbi:MAG: gamma carbonic anhydrase family protein [Paracoccaceae bacterium]